MDIHILKKIKIDRERERLSRASNVCGFFSLSLSFQAQQQQQFERANDDDEKIISHAQMRASIYTEEREREREEACAYIYIILTCYKFIVDRYHYGLSSLDCCFHFRKPQSKIKY